MTAGRFGVTFDDTAPFPGGTPMPSTDESRSGLILGFTAYGLWGLLPLYWHLLESTGATEVLAHRMVWSLPTAVAVLALLRRWSWIPQLLRQPRKLALLLAAA